MTNLFNWPDYVGRKGQRLRLNLRFLERKDLEKGFKSYLYLFEDEKGNRFAWFSDAVKLLNRGRYYKVTAKVASQKPYKGIPQTRLEDCRFVSNPH